MTFRWQGSCLQECLRSSFLILEPVFFAAPLCALKGAQFGKNFLRSQYAYENLTRVQIECMAVCIVTSTHVLVHILPTSKVESFPCFRQLLVKGLAFLHLLGSFLYLILTTVKSLPRTSVQNKLLHLALDPSKSCD